VGVRQLLNLGHTPAHSIETLSSFSISHGSAVAIGMALMARSATKQGLCPKSDLDDIITMLKSYSLPTKCDYSAKELADIALNDKKRSGGKINLIVPFGIGNSRIHEINVNELEDFFAKGL
jgi:3-dehydroquinate synthase